MNKVKPVVFVASPFQGPDETLNIDFARRVCREISLNTGAMPFAPHLLFPQFLNDKDKHERELGISYCSTMLALAKYAGFFVPKWRTEPSSGMRHEATEADHLGVENGCAYDEDDGGISVLVDHLGRRFPK